MGQVAEEDVTLVDLNSLIRRAGLGPTYKDLSIEAEDVGLRNRIIILDSKSPSPIKRRGNRHVGGDHGNGLEVTLSPGDISEGKQ